MSTRDGLVAKVAEVLWPYTGEGHIEIAEAVVTAIEPVIRADQSKRIADDLELMASGYTRESPHLRAGREIIAQIRRMAEKAAR